MRTLKLWFVLLTGFIIFSACTKENPVSPVRDVSSFEDGLVYGNDTPQKTLFAGKILDNQGSVIDKGGMISLYYNDDEIDVYVSDDGYYRFDDLPYRAYTLKYYFTGYESKTVANRFPQNTLYADTLYPQ